MKNSNIPTEALLDWLSINFPTGKSLEPIKRKIVDLMMVRHYPNESFDSAEADECWAFLEMMDHSELIEWCEESGDSPNGLVDLYSVAVHVIEQNEVLNKWNEQIAKG